MGEKSSMAKWEGKVSRTLTKASADEIWPLFKDFFNYHKWFPNLSTCYGVHGVNGEVGCVRYCARRVSVPNKNGDVEQVKWAKERLVAVDPNEMSMSYEFVDCNIGFNSYLSTVKVVPRGGKGCVVEWSFSVDPVEGLTYEHLVQNIYEDGLDHITKKMEDAVVHKNTL